MNSEADKTLKMSTHHVTLRQSVEHNVEEIRLGKDKERVCSTQGLLSSLIG